MFKLFVFCLILAVASAGLIHGHGAISTINSNLAAYHPVPVAVAHAPVVVGHGFGGLGGLGGLGLGHGGGHGW